MIYPIIFGVILFIAGVIIAHKMQDEPLGGLMLCILSVIVIMLHSNYWYEMAFVYRDLKSQGEVLQQAVQNARLAGYSLENAHITAKVVDYNNLLRKKQLANTHNIIGKHYIDDRVMDLPIVE